MALTIGQMLTIEEMRQERQRLAAASKSLVFTNGCFDILHTGHVTYLEFARDQGDALVIGLNSDESVRRNKGPLRPINSQEDRGRVLEQFVRLDPARSTREPRAPRTVSASAAGSRVAASPRQATWPSGRTSTMRRS